ncbi:MAG: YdeI/OmpD-associated family protein [Fimbriimonadales bacterium]
MKSVIVNEDMNPKPVEETEPRAPADLREALAAAPLAEAAWRDLTPIARRDFTSWINEAKQAETRARRIERCCENLVKGKKRPCCYAVVPVDFYKALGNAPEAKAQWSALTADEKRDFSDWVEVSEDKATRMARIEKTCALLAAGKRCP